MTADTILRRLGETARRRRRANVLLHAAPWLCVLAVLAWRNGWKAGWVLALALAVVAAIWFAWHSARTIDAQWLARRLDALRPDMEDSAALLFPGSAIQGISSFPRRADSGEGPPGPLQQLQRERLRQRLETGPPPDLREPWHRRTLLASLLAALVEIGRAHV